ncbi:MAG TPA: hypothetical protein VMR81_04155 [Patescibacteria group bacterium]|nr:hypothetical protein [Patescibacteria group bacterium]
MINESSHLPTYFQLDTELQETMRKTWQITRPIALGSLSKYVDHPEIYRDESAADKSRYHFLGIASVYTFPEFTDFPVGMRLEANSFLFIYQDYPLHPKTEKLMQPKKSVRDWLTGNIPRSPIKTPPILAVSSIEAMRDSHNPDDTYLIMRDFHAGRFGPPDDQSRETYLEERMGLGYFRWVRLFVDISEQLVVFLNRHNKRHINAIRIDHHCNNEKPGRDGTFKGERIAREKKYINSHKGYSYLPADQIIPDSRFQEVLEDMSKEA